MKWVRHVEDGTYILRRTFEGWTLETVDKRGRNLFGPVLVTPAAALAIMLSATGIEVGRRRL